MIFRVFEGGAGLIIANWKAFRKVKAGKEFGGETKTLGQLA